MNSRLRSLIKKEFLQFFRDKALVVLVVYTFLEIAICGWALFLDIKNVSIAVYDMDKSTYSRELTDKLSSTGTFKLNYTVQNYPQVDDLLNQGKVLVAVIVPRDFEKRIILGDQAGIQLLVDGSNSNSATLALAYANKIVRGFSENIEIKRLGLTPDEIRRLPGVVNRVTAWYSPGLKFQHFSLISMIAIAALFIGVLLTSGALVREKDAGTLEQLMVTPVRPYELILAKMLPMGVVKLAGLGVGILIAVFLFGVPIRGSLLLFFALSAIMFFAAMGIGVFIATLARNMQQALLLSFFTLFPVMFLSGTIVPITNMPKVLQWLSLLSPLRYYTQIALGIFLKGAGMQVLWPQVLGLAAIGLAVFSLSVWRFKQALE